MSTRPSGLKTSRWICGAEFHADPNRGHFIRTEEFDAYIGVVALPALVGA